MKEFLRAKIFALSQYLEMLLSLILGLVIVILAGKLLMDVFNPQYIFAGEDVFAYYLETAMNLAIGVELLKCFACTHRGLSLKSFYLQLQDRLLYPILP